MSLRGSSHRGRGACWPASWAVALALLLPGVWAQGPIDVTGWVSELWEPIETHGGQLLPNPPEEVVAILHRRAEVPGHDPVPVGSRGLAIFGMNQQDRYYRIVLAERLLPCVGCLGTFDRNPGGAPFEVEIRDRELSVGWISNANGLVSVRLTFAWVHKERAFGLIRDEVQRLDGDLGVRTRRVRDYRSGRQWMDGKPSPMEPRFVPIESVSADDYQ